MSRFFGTASDSDTESDRESEEEVPSQRPNALPTYTVCLNFIFSNIFI